VLDGAGESFEADVGVRGDRIVYVGRALQIRAARTIDCRGLAVAPGFIDIHGHSDAPLLQNGLGLAKLRQGVTTEVFGQDGRGLAPLTPEERASTARELGLNADWADFAGLFAAYEHRGVALNFLYMIGAARLRQYVLGVEARPVSAAELGQMLQALRAAQRQGARYLSSGLEYIPGAYATTDELIALAREAGLYATHMRNEDDHVEAALEEALRIGEGSGCHLHISHLKAQGRRNWDKQSALLARLESYARSGRGISFDAYPYPAYSVRLSSLLPVWARHSVQTTLPERLAVPEERARLEREFTRKLESIGASGDVMIAEAPAPELRAWEGRRLDELSRALGRSPFELVCEALLRLGERVVMIGFAMSEANVIELLRHPLGVVSSDGAAFPVSGGEGRPHPRNFGAFPHFLGRYVRELGVMSLERAVQKLSGAPAKLLRLADRGRVAPGCFADLVVFDPDHIGHPGDYLTPRRAPTGLPHVIVNGRVVLFEGEATVERPGRRLSP
jgi:N-acyl-D-amino-acid deacylase